MLTIFLSYANQYTKPFNEISGVVTELQNAVACAARIFELLDEKEQPSDEGKRELPKAEGNVELKDVYFSYRPEQKLIEDFSLSVKPGQRVAIVGPTGCGKTTLINLLMRFYDVTGGSVKVEGEDVRDITRKSLRSNYGMVLQETWLKSGTVRDNLKMGKPEATDEEMIAAAKAPMPTDLSDGCPRDTIPCFPKTAEAFRRDRNSFFVLRESCFACRPCSFWTRRRPLSTRARR